MHMSHHGILSEFDRHLNNGRNPADIFHELDLWGQPPASLLSQTVHRALVQKQSYRYLSFNLQEKVPDWRALWQLSVSADNLDSVVAYYQSEQELLLINPKLADHWKTAALRPGSLIVIYTRSFPERSPESEKELLSAFRSICEHPPENVTGLSESPVESPLPIRETPRYAVPVTNEFFHYGNVEAWRNIIEHYHEKHPGIRPVHRIGALFKWGRVNNGDVIHFSLAGPEFKNVAKLKKYLMIGASPRYMPFIKKRLQDSLNLF